MLKDLLKSIIRRTPYRVIRARAANRFSAIEECLQSLARRGYRPLRIVDGGANVGDFARCADRIFRPAAIHLVEPQPACRRSLAALARDHRYHLHAVALGADDTILYLTIDPNGITTGAHIDLAPETSAPPRISVQVKRLDQLLDGRIYHKDRTLLKMDLQGWELEALQGAEQSLQFIEVILTEVSFFVYGPRIETLIQYLDERGFALHDIAALAGRRRDNRALQGDFVFVRKDSALSADTAWA